MDWGKVIYVFFTLMSLTTTAGFLYEDTVVSLFLAGSVNLISTVLKIGVRNLLAAELFAGSLVADLHLIPAFFAMQFWGNVDLAISLCIGAMIANVFTIVVILVESAQSKDIY